MKKESIQKNYIFNLLNQMIVFLVPLIITPYISRIFSADGVGINSYTTANVTYFTLFSMFGISGYGQRSIAICRDDKEKTSQTFWELQFIHLITAIITFLLFLVLICFSPNYKIYYIAHITTLIGCFLDICWFYQAYEKFQFISIRNCIVRIGIMILTFLLVHEKSDLVIYILINSMGTVLANLSLWVSLKKYVDYVPIKELRIKRHLKDIIIFFVPTIATSVYSILDKSVINWVTHSDAENGYYEQAYKILTISNAFVQALSTVYAPRMSNMYSNSSREEFERCLNKALGYMMLIAFPVAFGVVGITERFVPLFFGEGYDQVVTIIYVFMPLVIILGLSVYLNELYLVPINKRAQSAAAVCAGSVLNLFLNIALVIWRGAFGAAVATLITECFIAAIILFLSRKAVDKKMFLSRMLKYGSISAVMGMIVYSLGRLPVNDFLCVLFQIAMGGSFYLAVLLILRDDLLLSFIRSFTKSIIDKYHHRKYNTTHKE